jgi:hypothetical protein
LGFLSGFGYFPFVIDFDYYGILLPGPKDKCLQLEICLSPVKTNQGAFF